MQTRHGGRAFICGTFNRSLTITRVSSCLGDILSRGTVTFPPTEHLLHEMQDAIQSRAGGPGKSVAAGDKPSKATSSVLVDLMPYLCDRCVLKAVLASPLCSHPKQPVSNRDLGNTHRSMGCPLEQALCHGIFSSFSSSLSPPFLTPGPLSCPSLFSSSLTTALPIHGLVDPATFPLLWTLPDTHAVPLPYHP